LSAQSLMRGHAGWIAVIGACSFALGCLLGLAVVPGARNALFPEPLPKMAGQADIGGPFALIDQHGRSVTDRTVAGRPMLVVFGATKDLDQTPLQLQMVAAALERLGPRADRIVAIFITLDPEHDRPELLAGFLARFHPKLIGLSGTAEDIAAVARGYKVPFVRRGEFSSLGGYVIQHDSPYYLMNSEGQYVTNLTQDVSLDVLVRSLWAVL
jgi:protein SCO1